MMNKVVRLGNNCMHAELWGGLAGEEAECYS